MEHRGHYSSQRVESAHWRLKQNGGKLSNCNLATCVRRILESLDTDERRYMHMNQRNKTTVPKAFRFYKCCLSFFVTEIRIACMSAYIYFDVFVCICFDPVQIFSTICISHLHFQPLTVRRRPQRMQCFLCTLVSYT